VEELFYCPLLNKANPKSAQTKNLPSTLPTIPKKSYGKINNFVQKFRILYFSNFEAARRRPSMKN
jgi:hypothetical protein